ncbi:porin [Lentibacter sp. XHP0401]|uniref:porin n=1 Tax=Lentibacter sp. XHP0401 TaxID=2984334 RepID=UPI0021E85B42|nr:porin [Lentibacter sp. XHP0401]MCV2894247.1 porin [Lentibacter sp. XHP0401]
MKRTIKTAGSTCALLLASTAAFAEGSTGFSWEGELELGVDSVVSSDVASELTDVYGVADFALEYSFSNNVRLFAGFTIESVLDPVDDRVFEDVGAYIGELGIAFNLGRTELSAGKISPSFGIAWDATPGFYGTSYAEDYELSEMIGVATSTELGNGTLSATVFYADNTGLSESLGTSRGRVRTSDGGAGNTGKLDNIALQYDVAFGSTTLSAGARYLSAGVGDASDEKGLSLGVVHEVNDQLSVMGEIARFDGYGGSTDDATYATIGASFASGPLTYNAAFTHRDITSTGEDKLLSLGVDYELNNGRMITAGLGFADEGGDKSTMLGVAFVIPLGG